MARMNWTSDQSRRLMRDNGTDRSPGRQGVRMLICPACGRGVPAHEAIRRKTFLRCRYCRMSIYIKAWGTLVTTRRLR
jgi:DNA-directed RNA polymerase subunit RPC12/RpoP